MLRIVPGSLVGEAARALTRGAPHRNSALAEFFTDCFAVARLLWCWRTLRANNHPENRAAAAEHALGIQSGKPALRRAPHVGVTA